jgi:CHAT domain-containing protein
MKPAFYLILIMIIALFLQQVKTSWATDPLPEITTLLAAGRYSEAASSGEDALNASTLPESLRISIASVTAQAHIKAGNSRHAIKLIDKFRAATKISERNLSRLLQVAALAAISNGDAVVAGRYMDEVADVKGLSPEEQAMHLFIRGMIARQTVGKEVEAEVLFRKADESAILLKGSTLLPAILLQRGKLAVQSGDAPKAISCFKLSITASEKINPDDDLVNILAEAGWALHQLTRSRDRTENAADSGIARQAMIHAAELSLQIGNYRARSNALARAGEATEVEEDLEAALKLALDAIDSAQKGRHADLLPSRQHIAARILKKKGAREASLAMYRAAAQNLELSKRGILPDCSTSTAQYLETVRPVYLELADLLIERTEAPGAGEFRQELLLEVRNTLEMLRTEELRDYFGDACLGSGRMEVVRGNSPPGAAVLYTVIFPDRMELLVSLPDGMKRFKVDHSLAEIGREARMLRITIESRFDSWESPAKKLYDWIIRPLEQELKRQNISRLVFVPDGPLRNVPLTVLHDGTSPVIERYSIITLQNLAFASRSKAGQNGPAILMAGISESVQGYPALANVERELAGIGATRNGSVTLLNSQFLLQNIKKSLESSPFPFLHFASHGEFTGSSRDNFILTWEGKMTLDHLERFIRSGEMKKTPVEILSLSACRTAAGDDRATLGLAGLAVKSGARNSIASLWDVEDKSTSELFIEFYRILATGEAAGSAEAFRKAQLTMRTRYGHPYFWSPFLFIGAWF